MAVIDAYAVPTVGRHAQNHRGPARELSDWKALIYINFAASNLHRMRGLTFDLTLAGNNAR